jgi:hypothetical protein
MNANNCDPKTLQLLMGYSKFSTTYDFYVTSGDDQKRSAMDDMGGILKGLKR